MSRASKAIVAAASLALLVLVGLFAYVKSHPLVFNESLWEHAHCMPQAGGALMSYAQEHAGQFPYSTNGWGDALLMLTPTRSWFYFINGPSYDDSAFEEAFVPGGNVDETRCGRVYVQGLSETSNPELVILFDRVAAPPDHCHFPLRLWAGFVREVCFVDGSWRAVPVESWDTFAQKQIDMLVEAGFARQDAEQIYSEVR